MHEEAAVSNRVKALRLARNWSQEGLARRAGVSRAGISAIETGRLVPSVAAALGLADAFGLRVEDLFHRPAPSVPAWAWSPACDPIRYWHAEVNGRVLLYPAEQTALGVAAADGQLRDGDRVEHPQAAPHETLVLASCDPAMGLLASQLARRSGYRLLAWQRSSTKALDLLAQGLVHVAGVHWGREGQSDENVAAIRNRLGDGYTLLRVAVWDEGIAVTLGLGLRSVDGLLAARLRWVGREPGSVARQRLDDLLADRPAPRRIAGDHRGVAQAVRWGWADAGICHRLVCEEAGLDFVGLARESYDLCWPKALDDDPRIEALVATIQSADYRMLLGELPGVDARSAGELAALNN